MNKEKIILISDYVLENEENLLMTAQLVKAIDTVVEKLAKGFLDKLEKELQSVLGNDWIIYNYLKDDVFGKSDFCIAKKNWNNLYLIGFIPDRIGLKDMDFYVWRNVEKVVSPIKDGILNKLLNENYKKGKLYQNGDWWQYLDAPYRDWTTEEAILMLYRKTEMVNYFVNQFIKIKDIVEPVIDKEIKKYI